MITDWNSISKYRSALMGFSILWIYFYHYHGLQLGGIIGRIVDAFLSVGWIGVDIFLFLSAIGCCFSLSKDTDTFRFYKRRVLRIIPTWWFFLTFFLVIAYVRQTVVPENISDFCLYYSGIGWWLNGLFETPRQVYYEWYVPTLLLFYTAVPLLFKRNIRTLQLMFFLTTLFSVFLSYYGILSSIYWSYQRIPVFILGVLFGKWMITGNIKYKKFDIWLLVFILGSLVFLIVWLDNPFHRLMNLAILRFAVTMFLPQFCVLLGRCIKSLRLSRSLTFVGGVTLELYMLHIYNLPLDCAKQYIGNHTIAVLLTLAFCILTAYIVSIVFSSKWFMTNK